MAYNTKYLVDLLALPHNSWPRMDINTDELASNQLHIMLSRHEAANGAATGSEVYIMQMTLM